MKMSMLLLEVQGKGVSLESSVFFSQERTERSKEFFMFISLYNICVFIITCRTKRTEKSPLSFFRQDRKEKGIFCSFHFTTYVSLLLQAGRKEQRNYLFPLSGRTERKKELFLFISLCNICVFIITGRTERTWKFPFSSLR